MSRSRAFELTALATAHFHVGETATGIALGWEAAHTTSQLRSTRAIDRLTPLATAAAAHPSSDAQALAAHLTSTDLVGTHASNGHRAGGAVP